jgi:transposase
MSIQQGERSMAYRQGEDPQQTILFPRSLSEYVDEQHVVRAYDQFVESLNLTELGILEDEHRVGNPEYHPRLMLKLLIYGYSYGIRSSRKLEREVHNNVTFMWLMRNLKPDHKTIAEFRRKHKKALQKALRICAQLCMKLNLMEGNILFLDGTKIRANAGRHQNHTQDWYQKQLATLDERIAHLLSECEQIDLEEADQASWVMMQKELARIDVLKTKIEEALQSFQRYEAPVTTHNVSRMINQTDPDSALMHSIHGTHTNYNVQSVVDDQNGLIAAVDVTHQATDFQQFSTQIQAAEEILGKPCEVACADAGYANTKDLAKVQSDTTTVVVPSQRQVHEDPNPFKKARFRYDAEADCYYCPEGQSLAFRKVVVPGEKLRYQVSHPSICRGCLHDGICTQSKSGRRVIRLVQEEVKEQIEKNYHDPFYQAIYQRRKCRVELPFGHLKYNLGIRQFYLRGRDGVLAESALGALGFNLTRMITILGGVQPFIQALQQM